MFLGLDASVTLRFLLSIFSPRLLIYDSEIADVYLFILLI